MPSPWLTIVRKTERLRWQLWVRVKPARRWLQWDTTQPPGFSDPSEMTSSIENLALSKAQGLTSVKAVDEAHFAIIDAYIDELMAPLYEAAERDWQFGLRVLEGLNAQGLEEAARTCGKAKNAARKAQAAENEFAVVYRHWVGTEPVTDTTMAPFDHRQYRQHWDAERLQLAADKGVLGQTAWGFRGTVTQACPPVIPDQAPRNEQ